MSGRELTIGWMRIGAIDVRIVMGPNDLLAIAVLHPFALLLVLEIIFASRGRDGDAGGDGAHGGCD